MALAYSYVRFSTDRQKLGDSVRRQIEKAEVWAKTHGLTVDTKSYLDVGKSAYKGKHLSEGGFLKAFIDAVEAGAIPKGSFLLVESLDRLSRQEVDDALELFLRLNRLGITIVDTTTGQQFSRDQSKNDRIIALMTMIMVAVRANEESVTKADRLSRAWAEKRAEAAKSGKIITRLGPIWLKLNADENKWIVDKLKAAVVKELFELAAAGYGAPTIARMFNESKKPTLTGRPHWSFTSINLLLHNRATIGVYTPQRNKAAESIKGYFPAIIDETLFIAVQDAIKKRRWIGGRNGHMVTNIFAGMSWCAKCGSRMRVIGSSNSKNLYLKCISAYSNTGCKEGRFPYVGAERGILRWLADELSEVMAKAEVNEEDPVAVVESEMLLIEDELDNLIDLYQKVRSDKVAERIANREARLAEVKEQLFTTPSPAVSQDARAEAIELFNRLKQYQGPLDVEMRHKVQVALRQVVARVQFLCDADYSRKKARRDARDDVVTTMTGARPTIAFDYVPDLGGETVYIDVAKYLDRPGTYSRQRVPKPSRPKQS